jgi:hypothetical protein
MDFKKRIKGAVTQTLVKSLLEDAGYRVVPLGVEEMIREVISLDAERYKDLNLPKVLRYMPDFFVADTGLEASWLVEVKYRKTWNEAKASLGKQIFERAKHWSPLFLIIFLGTPANGGNESPRYSVGAMKLAYEDENLVCIVDDKTKKKWDEIDWEDFGRLQDVFKKVNKQWEKQTITHCLPVLRSLKELDFE